MARRNKLQKFTELLTFPNVYENFDPSTDELVHVDGKKVRMKARWREAHFRNDQPLVLELACGRGEYCLGLARRHPHNNYIGVDIKGARIWKGARTAIREKLDNVAFLRSKIEFLDQFFGTGEVDEIWITFPDPFLKKSKYNRRLSSPNFLARYSRFLKKDGVIHLKTDSDELYEHTLEVLDEEGIVPESQSSNINEGVIPHPDLDIQTYYEKMHRALGKNIKYVRFRLNYPPPTD